MSKTYTTVQGDMWDSISHSQLGDVRYTDLLMMANLQYRDVYVFSAGITLTIPDIDKKETNPDLPPWKRVSG